MRPIELGVFMPVGSNGFLMSKRTPRYHPTFPLHRDIALRAEAIGLDYLFWMGKWMGFGGESRFWEETIEPMSMVSAIAPLTSRLKLFATVNPLLFHPAVAAKIVSTIDGISGGRFGINIVTGNTLEELEQMGVVPEDYGSYRYQYADEWIGVMKLLWSQERTDFSGRFFQLSNCVSGPKPVRKPHPLIVSAGISDEGLDFGVRHSDYQFTGHRSGVIDKVKGVAAEKGRTIKTVTNALLIFADNDDAAEREYAAIKEELDHEAVENLIASFERDNRDSYKERTAYLRDPNMVGFGSGTPLVGSPATVAEKIAALVEDSGVDAVQFTFVDFVKGLDILGAEVLPRLRSLLAAKGIALGSPAGASAVAS